MDMDRLVTQNISSKSKVLDAGRGYDAAIISEYCGFVAEAIGVDSVDKFGSRPQIKT